MAVREVLRMGHPLLARVARPVTDFGAPLAALLEDMRDTMAAENGAGLAAPQIGESLRVVVFGFQSNPRYPDAEPVPYTVLVNPVITPLDDAGVEALGHALDGAPGLVEAGVADVHGARHHAAKARDGQAPFPAFLHRVVQHECDHLDGILYPQRMTDMRHFGFTDILFPDLDPREDD